MRTVVFDQIKIGTIKNPPGTPGGSVLNCKLLSVKCGIAP